MESKCFGDWRDLPEKNEEQCEFCGKFYLDIEKHRNYVHGKNQTKLFASGENDDD